MESKKLSKEDAIKEISHILIEQEEVKKERAEILELFDIKKTKELELIANNNKLITEYGDMDFYNNYMLTKDLLCNYFGEKIELRKSNDTILVCLGKRVLLKLNYDIFKNKLFFKTSNKINIILALLGKRIFKKEHCKTQLTWSYINEESESKNMSQQIEYNQTLSDFLIELKVDNIMVNSKLKPLIETLNSYDIETSYITATNDSGRTKKIKVTFIKSEINENTIACYNHGDLKPLNDKAFSNSDLNYIIELYGENVKMSTPFTSLEIVNLDNGVFGIKNDLVRVENGKQLILHISKDADLDYIGEILLFNKKFTGIEHIDLKNPKSKYSYHTKMIAGIKNKE